MKSFLTAALPLLAGALLAPAAAAAACPTVPSWPTHAWPSRVQEVAAQKSDAIRALEAYATLSRLDPERKGIRTDGVVVIHRGDLIYERYAPGYAADKRHLSWSVSKSFTNALVGRAVQLGALSLSDSVCQHLSLPAGTEGCGITVQDLLEFASGLDWTETYEGKSNQASSVLAMLYGEGRKDMATFVATHRLRDAPGTSFMYSSGDTTLLASVLGEAVKTKLGMGEDFPWTLLFEPLGIRSATWERDAKGHFVGSSYLYATPRDLARFGYFFLRDGCWEGQGGQTERLLPEGWVADSTSVSRPYRLKTLDAGPGDVQGRLWWLNQPVPERNVSTRPWPDVPADAFAARGHWGQSITVIPSLDLVVVRTADDREPDAFDLNHFLSLALALVR